MRMSVWVWLRVLTCTDAHSTHGCMVRMWEERILIDYSPHLWGWPHYCPSPHPPSAFSNLFTFVLPSKHTHLHTPTENPTLTAVALPHECAHVWTVGLKGHDVEHILNLTCIPNRGLSLLLVAANQRRPKLAICPNIISKRITLCYLSLYMCAWEWNQSFIQHVSETRYWCLAHIRQCIKTCRDCSLYKWKIPRARKVQVLSAALVLFISFALHLLSCLFQVISRVWNASVKA